MRRNRIPTLSHFKVSTWSLNCKFVETINNLLAIHNLVDNFCLFYLLMKCLWVDHNFLIFIIHYNYLLNNFCKQFLFCSSLPLRMFIIQNLVCETNYLSHILDFVQCSPDIVLITSMCSPNTLSSSINLNCILLWTLLL